MRTWMEKAGHGVCAADGPVRLYWSQPAERAKACAAYFDPRQRRSGSKHALHTLEEDVEGLSMQHIL